jgi:hypothetical protein
METYTHVLDKATRDALRRLSDSLGSDRGREAHDAAQLRAEVDDEPGKQAWWLAGRPVAVRGWGTDVKERGYQLVTPL